MNSETLKGDNTYVDLNADQNSSDDEYNQKLLSLRDKKEKYYENMRIMSSIPVWKI